QPFSQALRVEYGDGADPLAGAEGGGEVVRTGRRGDDGAGCVEDRRDHDVQAFAGAGWTDEQDRVLHTRPDLTPLGGANPVTDIRRHWIAQRGPKCPGAASQRLARRGLGDFLAGGGPGEAPRVTLGLP